MPWPPTPGSYQSATINEPSGATATSLGRNQRFLTAVEEVHDLGFVAGAVGLGDVAADDVRTGIAVDGLAVEDAGEQIAFIDLHAGGAACAGEKHVRDDAGVVLMPVTLRDLAFPTDARDLPAFAGHFVGVAVVAELHDVVDAHAFVAVVVVVGLPQGAEAIDGDFPVVAEVPGEHLDVAAIELAAEDHALLVGAVVLIGALHAVDVGDEVAVLVAELFAGVAKVEVEAAIGAEVEGVDAVVVLCAADLGEHELFAVGFVVAVVVDEPEDVVAAGDEGFVAEHADAVGAVHVRALMEDGGFVGLGVAIGVFEDEDAVALGAFAVVLAVVDDFADPHAATRVDVDAGGAAHHGLAGKELHRQFGMHNHLRYGICWLVARRAPFRTWGDRSWITCIDAELHACGLAVLLLRSTFVEDAPRFKSFGIRRHVVGDGAIGVRSETVSQSCTSTS